MNSNLALKKEIEAREPQSPVFNGQQSDERILYGFHPHLLSYYVNIIKFAVVVGVVFAAVMYVARYFPESHDVIKLWVTGLICVVLVGGAWWFTRLQGESVTYVTDRRIVRFEPIFPFGMAKRSLFWNEVLKAKGSGPNIFYRFLKIGTVGVYPALSDEENVIVPNTYYYDDLVNYIDKILFVVKNKPHEIGSLMPFVTRPKGKRY